MIVVLWRGANASLRALWTLALPLFIAAMVILLIAALPFASAPPSVSSLLKALIAVPVGLAVAFGKSQRRFLALLLVGTMGLLLITFIAVGYPQGDPAVETAVISLGVLGAWLTLPYLLPRRLRSKGPPDAAELWRAAASGRVKLRAFFSSVRLRLWLDSIRWSGRAVAALAALAALCVLLALALSIAGRTDAPTVARLGLLAADAAAGAVAVWLLARRILGNVAALAAGLFWAACSVRLEASGVGGTAMLPTSVLPAVAALLMRARDRGLVRGLWFGLTLSLATVALALFWPLLALTTGLATILLAWSVGYQRDARWACGAIVAWAFCVCLAVPERTVARLALESSISDPVHAAVACASGCDGGLPWEFFYPSPFGSLYSIGLTHALRATLHWGNYQAYAISPGWAQLALAVVGAVVLWRRRRRGLLTLWFLGIVLGIVLSLPSHYLGLGLPSFTRLVTSAAPSFSEGAQMSLLGALFVALLAGTAANALVVGAGGIRLVPTLAIAALVLADIVSIPVLGHPGTVLAKLSARIPRDRDAAVTVAFYPLLTPDYGPEYGELAAIARRHGLTLVNARGDENALSDLSSLEVQDRLRAAGVRFIIVSVADYVRRREMLDEAHILLPLDQEGNAVAWLAPEPAEISRLHLLHADIDGSLLLAP